MFCQQRILAGSTPDRTRAQWGFRLGQWASRTASINPIKKIPLISLRAAKKASERIESKSCHEESLLLVNSPLLHAAVTCKPGVSQARKKVTQS